MDFAELPPREPLIEPIIIRVLSSEGAIVLAESMQHDYMEHAVSDWMMSDNPAEAADGHIIRGYLRLAESPRGSFIDFDEARRLFVDQEEYVKASQVLWIMQSLCEHELADPIKAEECRKIQVFYQGAILRG